MYFQFKTKQIRAHAKYVRALIDAYTVKDEAVIEVQYPKHKEKRVRKIFEDELGPDRIRCVKFTEDEQLTELHSKLLVVRLLFAILIIYGVGGIGFILLQFFAGVESLWIDFFFYLGNVLGVAFGLMVIRNSFQLKSWIFFFLGIFVIILNGAHVVSFLDRFY